MNKAPNASVARSIYNWTWIRSSCIFATCKNVLRHIESLVDHQTTITNIASDPHLGGYYVKESTDVVNYVGPTYAVGRLDYVFAWVSFFLSSFLSFFLSFFPSFFLSFRQKSCPGLHSTTTGPIITIRTPLESSQGVGVHWLCHLPDIWFQKRRNCPKLPDRPPPKILSRLTLGNYWPDYHDSKSTWKLSGCRCALVVSFAWFTIPKCPKLGKTAWSGILGGILTAHHSNWAPLGPTFCFRPLGAGHCLVRYLCRRTDVYLSMQQRNSACG